MGSRIGPAGGRVAKTSLLYAGATRGLPTDTGGLKASNFDIGVQMNYRFVVVYDLRVSRVRVR